MPLTVPEIDDRTFEELVAEARARIPVHNPEWTNFNASDPGITLLQLFAFMTESLLYRSSLVPERNRKKFLKLLGIGLQPAAAARGIVSFNNLKGPLQSEVLPEGVALFAGQVQFQTLEGLEVLPVEGQVYYKATYEGDEEVESLYEQLYASYTYDGADLAYYETRALPAPASGGEYPVVDLAQTSDGALWVALLARSAKVVDETREVIARRTLTLGLLPALDERGVVLQPGGTPQAESRPALLFQVPRETTEEQLRQGIARYRTLDARPSGDLLSEPGTVQLTLPAASELILWDSLDPTEGGVGDLPPSLDDPALEQRLITWLRIRLPGVEGEDSATGSSQLSGKISWVGLNCAEVLQRVHVHSENVGTGTGEPDQRFTLVHTPVIEESVTLTINGELWTQVEDLTTAPSEVPVEAVRDAPGSAAAPVDREGARVFTVDRESGEVRFGDGQHGARPARRASIRADYKYGGGHQGNVGIGAINKGTALPAGVKVTNPLPTWGGDEPESVEQAETLIPRYLHHRDRLVTVQDYEDIVQRTPGVDLGRVEARPLFHPDAAAGVKIPGTVTVMVIPARDATGSDTPKPNRLFLDTICDYLDPRRVVTTELHVRGPRYKEIWVSAGIDVVPGESIAPVREAVKRAIRDFLSPLTGGFEGEGWPLDKAVEALEIWAVATRVEGVAKVNEVLLSSEALGQTESVPFSGLELPRLVALEVQAGDPLPLALLEGTAAAPAERVVPVPVVPPVC